METLPQSLYFANQVRALDQSAMETCGIDGAELMERAGAAVLRELIKRRPPPCAVTVLCGGGNNGGDGYVVARLALDAGYKVRLHAVLPPANDLCATQARAWNEVHSEPPETTLAIDPNPETPIIDAVFGTGLRRPVEGRCAELFARINRTVPSPLVLAVDIPSGLDSDSGGECGIALRATTTVTFIGLKTGLLTGRGREFCGELIFDALDIPEQVYAAAPCAAQRLHPDGIRAMLRRRPQDAHKGMAGHLLVVGGGDGMTGAVRMAAEAAYRVGGGLVTVCCEHEAQNQAIVSALPESLSLSGLARVHGNRRRFNALVIGPGLGLGKWGVEVMATFLESGLPMVIDADGLNLLAREPCQRPNSVLTPHPGEAARLLGCDVKAVQSDRFAAVREIASRYGAVCVLKGAGTLIAAEDGVPRLCGDGNHGMASGGMGDVLSGVIGGLLAQGYDPLASACIGVWLHANAADAAARNGGTIGIMATDLSPHARHLHNQLLNGLP